MMSLCLVDIHGEIEGDYDKVGMLPQNPTNGDIVIAMFNPSYIEVIKDEYEHEVGDIFVDIDGGTIFSLDWWNAPYKKWS